MKNFFILFTLFLNFCNAIIALPPAIQEKYKNVVQFSPDATASHVYIESAQLENKHPELKAFFKKHPETTLIVNFKKGDGFVDDKGGIMLTKRHLPSSLKKLIVTDSTKNIRWIKDCFLNECKLTHLTLDFPELTTIQRFFLKGAKKISIDFSPLIKLTNIDDGFLRDAIKPTFNYFDTYNDALKEKLNSLLEAMMISKNNAYFTLRQSIYPQISLTEEVIQKIRQSYPHATPFSPESTDEHIIIQGSDLTYRYKELYTFFKNPDNQGTTLIIDFQKGDGFVDDKGTLKLDRRQLPTTVHHLIISNTSQDIQMIDHFFLEYCENLQSIAFIQEFSKLKKIEGCFLMSCKNLTKIDISPFINVHTIFDNFLSHCGFSEINLSALSNIQIIPNQFLFSCVKLVKIDLSPFSKVHTIGEDFLANCGFETIDLTPLSNIQIIPNAFLAACVKLKNIDFSPLANVHTIGKSLLAQCTALKNVDFSPFIKVKQFGAFILQECANLETIDISGLGNVENKGYLFFVEKCPKLMDIQGMGEAARTIQSAVIHTLQNSENDAQKALGATFAESYLMEG